MTFDDFKKLTVEEQDKLTLKEFKEIIYDYQSKGDPIICKYRDEKNCIGTGHAPLWCIYFCPPYWWL